jgi:hypothetical protein
LLIEDRNRAEARRRSWVLDVSYSAKCGRCVPAFRHLQQMPGLNSLGVSKLEAYGNVFRLTKLSDFSGAYGAARAGAVAGDAQLEGGLWMENPAGVQIHMVPRRSGVALSLGADGVLITFDI